MTGFQDFLQRTFASLAVRNYRLFFIGQAVSLSGTWMQTVAQGLLVLELTGSGVALGTVTALQTLPVLLFGAWGGVIADRLPKRAILYGTQSASGCRADDGCAGGPGRFGSGWSTRWRCCSGSSRCSTTRRGRPSCARWSGRDGSTNAVS